MYPTVAYYIYTSSSLREQVYSLWYSKYPSSSFLTILLSVLDTFATVLSAHSLYIVFVKNWGNIPALATYPWYVCFP